VAITVDWRDHVVMQFLASARLHKRGGRRGRRSSLLLVVVVVRLFFDDIMVDGYIFWVLVPLVQYLISEEVCCFCNIVDGL
jgi:hypothetical protein